MIQSGFISLQTITQAVITLASLTPIPVEQLIARPVALWAPNWLLLTSGDFAAGHYNTMTVAWGTLGMMWNLPVAQVVVRPVRYTYEFMEQYPTFTLTAFPGKYRKALTLLGARSGRGFDKIAAAGLTPIAASQAAAPSFAEATLLIECRKIYSQDFDPARFLDARIPRQYPQKDYHRVYYGEILAVSGTEQYLAP
ncbi:MAG TPA: flavin reductase [Anaerolineaceae bacterium]|nr:flavin reductase [Anaerolineaceae bacterium]